MSDIESQIIEKIRSDASETPINIQKLSDFTSEVLAPITSLFQNLKKEDLVEEYKEQLCADYIYRVGVKVKGSRHWIVVLADMSPGDRNEEPYSTVYVGSGTRFHEVDEDAGDEIGGFRPPTDLSDMEDAINVIQKLYRELLAKSLLESGDWKKQ